MRLTQKAGMHAAATHDELARHLAVAEVQLDEKWSFLGRKKEANCDRADPADASLGDCCNHVALGAETKLAIVVVPGKRTLQSVRQLIGELAERTDRRLPRLITSDEYAPHRRALLEVYGVPKPWRRPARWGRVRRRHVRPWGVFSRASRFLTAPALLLEPGPPGAGFSLPPVGTLAG